MTTLHSNGNGNGTGNGLHEPVPRTQAQREASRRNGRRSRGPKTLEGKTRSSANSLKHGLLARQLAPPADYRRDDGLFRQLRRQLVDEFAPAAASGHALVEALAHDYILLGRCRAMVEAACRPPALGQADQRLWEQLQGIERDLPALERALESLVGGDDGVGCAQKPAERAASAITGMLAEIEADEQEQAAAEAELGRTATICPDAVEEEPDEHERALARLLDVLGPEGRRRLADRQYVIDLLRRMSTPKRGDRRRLRAAVEYAIAGRRRWLATFGRRIRRTAEQCRERAADQLAQAPERLDLLLRYTRQVESAIDRKLAQLRGA